MMVLGSLLELIFFKTEIEEKPEVEEEIRADVHSPVTSPVSPQGFESIRSPTSPEGVEIGENTDIYSLPKSDKKKKEKHPQRIFHMYSEDRVESPVSPQEDNKELYGRGFRSCLV